MNRRTFLAFSLAVVALAPFAGSAEKPRCRKTLLRSSWRTVNIGDIAHKRMAAMIALV